MSTMKLSLCILIILAVCCYEVNSSRVCENVVYETISLLLNCVNEMKKELEKFNAPPAAVKANLKVKRCIDRKGYDERFAVAETLMHAVLDCGVREWIETYYPEIDFYF